MSKYFSQSSMKFEDTFFYINYKDKNNNIISEEGLYCYAKDDLEDLVMTSVKDFIEFIKKSPRYRGNKNIYRIEVIPQAHCVERGIYMIHKIEADKEQ